MDNASGKAGGAGTDPASLAMAVDATGPVLRGRLEESFDLETLIVEFRDEARDQIDRLDARLLELEREGALDPEARTELLRTLHTLKGNAGMLGLSPIRDFVHSLENVFKSDPEAWSDVLVERLFEGAAALRAAVEVAGEDNEAGAFGDVTAARHRLETVEDPGGADRSRTAVSEPAEVPESSDLIRVPFHKLDTLLNEVGELLGDVEELERAMADGDPVGSRDTADSVRRRVDVLRESVMSMRLVPVGRLLGRFHGLVRRLAHEQGKEARLVVEGEGTEMDKSTAEALAEPLLHLIRNAIDHGLRSADEREAAGKPRYGTVRIVARHEGDRVRIAVEDDGVGLSLESIAKRAEELGLVEDGGSLPEEAKLALIFEPGFSTRTDVSTVSGRGVGLDVVRRRVHELRGSLGVERIPSVGTRFVIRLPVTVVIVPSLLFETAGETMAIPTANVDRTIQIGRIEQVGATEVIRDGEGLIPVADPDRLFGWDPAPRGDFGVVVRHGRRGALVTAQRLVDQRELVVKGMPSYGRRVPGVSGSSVLPGGRVVLVLDPAGLIDLVDAGWGGGRE
jgi:two-component system chemotaxis sensor kinase CheA